ncbi:hypothetical protein HYS49_02315 [Candidatus Woesearchaeota archaeon]|nr:hypothetical protein [Candidatus Woesearchaeota archaeon]
MKPFDNSLSSAIQPPTTEELRAWLLSTLRHVCLVEYFFQELHAGHKDPQRPHDIVGKGNKFSWDVAAGLAVQYRSTDPEFHRQYVQPAINFHREHQHHHQMWNQRNPKATPDDLLVGAIDTISSLLDDRPYQGGAHSLVQIPGIIGREEDLVKRAWLWNAYEEIHELRLPAIEEITSLTQFPNIGLPNVMYERIRQRTAEACSQFCEMQGYDGL